MTEYSEDRQLQELQELQDKMCTLGNVFGCCFDSEGNQLTEISGPERDLVLLSQYFSVDQFGLMFENIADSPLEELIVEETSFPWLYTAAIDVRNNPEKGHVWVFAIVVSEGDSVAVPAFTRVTTRAKMDSYLDLMVTTMRSMENDRVENITAQEEIEKSSRENAALEKAMRQVATTSEIIRLLDRETDSIEALMAEYLRIETKFLGISSGAVFSLLPGGEVALLASWSNGTGSGLGTDMAGIFRELGSDWNRQIILSSDTKADAVISDAMEELGIQAMALLPVIASNDNRMVVTFAEKRREHTWSMDEVVHMRDTLRVFQSIIIRRIQKNSLYGSYRSLSSVLDNVGCGVLVADRETGELLFANKYVTTNLESEMAAGTILDIFTSRLEKGRVSGGHEFHYTEKAMWFDFYYTEITWMGDRPAVLYSLYDISDKKAYQKKIEQQAYTDFLTGLYNRMCCERDLARYIDSTKQNQTFGYVLYLDLDDFKHINDGLGHQYGDVLLRNISSAMRGIPGLQDTCYRMGGDEFVIIVPPECADRLESILDEIGTIFSKPWYLKDGDYYCTMSMGVIEFPKDGDSIDDLIRRADLAMYDAKKSGKNRVARYDERLNEESGHRLGMEKHMRDATVKGCEEFEVYFMPIMDVSPKSPACVGAEALVRWISPDMGFVSPAEFIPLAEYLGLINPIGNHVLIKACEECKKWHEKGKDFKVNVNLSVVQLLQADILEVIKDALEISGLEPSNLILEVTESLAINDMRRMKRILGAIKDLGVGIALDDFGTGYSSLNHVREIPLDIIKVDQSFVTELAEDSYSQSFVKMVAELANTIGVSVCVEGIETEDQFRVLAGMMVKTVQGYYFGKPMPAADFYKQYVEDQDVPKKSGKRTKK